MANVVGIAGYSPGMMKSKSRALFEKVQKKVALRAALSAISAEIEATVPCLNASELAELQGLMAQEIEASDTDAAAFQQQIAEEAQLSRTQRPMQVTIPRRASAALGAEAERRVLRGIYPSAESLISEAILRAYS